MGGEAEARETGEQVTWHTPKLEMAYYFQESLVLGELFSTNKKTYIWTQEPCLVASGYTYVQIQRA